ncbi:MAG: acyl-CoA dehydrogenase family protein [Bdellovibrionia bacterium]
MDIPSDADPKTSWDKMRRFLGDADREMPLADWFKFLQRFGEQNPALALRVFLRRTINEITGGRETDCAIPLFGSPFGKGHKLLAATGEQPGRVLIPVFQDELQWSLIEHPGQLTGEPKLTGLESLPLGYLSLDAAQGKTAELNTKLFYLGPAHIIFGCVRRATRVTQVYMEERRQGGRLLIEWSQPARQLGDLQWALKLFEEKLENLNTTENPAKALAALLDISRFAPKAVSECIDLMGGAGYMADYGLEQILRDTLALTCIWGSVAEKRLNLDTLEEN